MSSKELILVEDHEVVSRGLQSLLTNELGFKVANSFHTGEQFLGHIKQLPDERIKNVVALLDLNLPGQNGLIILRQMKDAGINVPVIVLSMHKEEFMGIRAVHAGAMGYLNKDVEPDTLKKAITTVSSGSRYLSPVTFDALVKQVENPSQRPLHEHLSEREFDIFLLLSSGRSNKEIAERLFLSEKTVSTYRSRINEKMGMTSPSEYTRYVIEHGLTTD